MREFGRGRSKGSHCVIPNCSKTEANASRALSRPSSAIKSNATNEADNSDVQFSIPLFKDGRMRFDYGPGNTNLSPTIGASIGYSAGYLAAVLAS